MMLQEIAPHVYHNEYSPSAPKAEDRAVLWREGKLAMALKEEQLCLPQIAQVKSDAWQYLFRVDEQAYFLCMEDVECPEGFDWLPPRGVDDQQPQHEAFATAAAGSLARWYSGRRFCGGCGEKMVHSKTERAMVCPSCGKIVYPTICPAVIVGVTDGERLLLTRYVGRPFKRYALVAGFNEIGESIEATVRREVKEETGLDVQDLRFFASQPWCFSDSLLMGFFCRLRGENRIVLQEDELAEAVWFSREELPENHSRLSLTGNMIEFFRENGPEAIWGAGVRQENGN